MKKLTTATWVLRAEKWHGDLVDYSGVEYVAWNVKVALRCRKHDLVYLQTPNNHAPAGDGASNGRDTGCPKCRRENSPGAPRKKTVAWIKQGRAAHPHIGFDRSEYVTARLPIEVECPIHGPQVWATPNGFLKSHRGCAECAFIDMADGKRGGPDHFLRRAAETHGTTYGYPMHDYTGMREGVTIYCRDHGPFVQNANKHVMGTRCPDCAYIGKEGGFNCDKPGMLYYLRVDGGMYKIGITNNDVQRRYSLADQAKFTIVNAEVCEVGRDAYEWEQRILKAFAEYRYQGPDVLSSGNTELFTHDVLGLDV